MILALFSHLHLILYKYFPIFLNCISTVCCSLKRCLFVDSKSFLLKNLSLNFLAHFDNKSILCARNGPVYTVCHTGTSFVPEFHTGTCQYVL
jgi:hypothetical protein